MALRGNATGVVKMLSGRVLSRFFGSCLVCRINLIFSTPLTGAVCAWSKKILACSRPINIEIFHFEEQKTFRKKGKPKSWLYLSWFYEGEKLPPPPFWYLGSLSTQLCLNHFVKCLPNKACFTFQTLKTGLQISLLSKYLLPLKNEFWISTK